ncbi:MAG: nitroreductase, partial [Clostridia bacterium]|nr:nitroreductase [Clostridia bacterium]
KPIPAEVKQAILLAATQAPTAGKQQLYTLIDVTDPALKTRLADTCDHQPFIATAPMAVVFCADAQKWYDAYAEAGCTPRAPGPGDMLLAVQDAVIAAQNAVTAAWSLGVGSCYIGDILELAEVHRELLCLPPYVMPATMVVFGYPTEQQLTREKPERCALSHIVHENAYRRMDGAELRQMLAPRLSRMPFEAWVRAFCERKYQSDFAREMNRSVGVYARAFDGDTDQ